MQEQNPGRARTAAIDQPGSARVTHRGAESFFAPVRFVMRTAALAPRSEQLFLSAGGTLPGKVAEQRSQFHAHEAFPLNPVDSWALALRTHHELLLPTNHEKMMAYCNIICQNNPKSGDESLFFGVLNCPHEGIPPGWDTPPYPGGMPRGCETVRNLLAFPRLPRRFGPLFSSGPSMGDGHLQWERKGAGLAREGRRETWQICRTE